MKQGSKNKTYATLYLATALIATNGLFAKSIPLDAIAITALRSLFAACIIFVVVLLLRRGISLSSRSDFLGVYGIGILMGLHWATFFHSMQISTIAIGMLALYCFPIFIVLIEPFFSGKRLRVSDVFAGVGVLIGITIMAGPELLQLQSTVWQGLAWGILSAICFALRNVLQKYRYAHVSSEQLMLHQLLAISLLFCVLLFASNQPAALASLRPMDWFNVALMALVTTAMAHTLLVLSYKRLPAKTVAMISCTQPPIAAFLAWWFIGETVSTYVLIGGGLILIIALFESIRS